MEADAVRRRLHPEGIVTYTLDGKIDYGASGEATSLDRICNAISDTIAMGGTAVTLQGNPSPEHTIAWFEALFRSTKERFPAVWLHCLSASEVLAIAEQSGLSVRDAIAQLHHAGLDSIPGDDAGILDDAVQHSGAQTRKAEDWIAVHRAAHLLGVPTTATMAFGSGETFEHRVNHLEAVRQLQEETGGFTSFTPLSFAPQSSAMSGFEEATAVEYLKALAISRMYLDKDRKSVV